VLAAARSLVVVVLIVLVVIIVIAVLVIFRIVFLFRASPFGKRLYDRTCQITQTKPSFTCLLHGTE
jgi:hypothetical protein